MLRRPIIADAKLIGFEGSPAPDENIGMPITRNFKHDYRPLPVLLSLKLLPGFSKISLAARHGTTLIETSVIGGGQ
jgi:hypothetical protein